MPDRESNFKKKLFEIAISIDKNAKKTWIDYQGKFRPASFQFRRVRPPQQPDAGDFPESS